MPRPLRIEFEDAWYHVMNRGAGHRKIFHTNDFKKLFLETLAEASELFGIEIHAYCLMDNHYHLLIKTPHGNLSRAMRHINGIYTQRFNRLKKTDGSLFRGRYKAIVVEEDNYLLQVSRYIHLNPINAKIVQKPEKFEWSSYAAYLSLKAKPGWLYTKQILSMLSGKEKTTLYMRFVDSGIDSEVEAFYKKQNIPVILGSDSYKERLIKSLSVSKKRNSATDYKQVKKFPTINEINEACAKYFKVSKEQLYESRRGHDNEVRRVAIYGCRVWGAETLSRIAKHYRFESHSYVSKVIKEIKERLKTEPSLKVAVAKILKLLE